MLQTALHEGCTDAVHTTACCCRWLVAHPLHANTPAGKLPKPLQVSVCCQCSTGVGNHPVLAANNKFSRSFTTSTASAQQQQQVKGGAQQERWCHILLLRKHVLLLQQQRTVVTGYVTLVHHALLSAMPSAAASSARDKACMAHLHTLGVQAAPGTFCIRQGGLVIG